MKPTLFQRMDVWAPNLVPVGITLLLLLLSVIPSRLPDFAVVVPMLTLMGVFYWAIYRPDLMPAWAAFGIGLIYDLVGGMPLGINALVLLLVQGAASSQRRFFLGNTFLVAWSGFAVIGAAAFMLAWLLVMLLVSGVGQPKAVVFELLLTIAFYPVVSWTLARTQVAVLPQP